MNAQRAFTISELVILRYLDDAYYPAEKLGIQTA